MIKKNPLYSEKGITLVELVVAMGIGAIIITVLTSMFMDSNKLFYEGEEISFNQTHMRNAVDEITKDLRYAKDLSMLKEEEVIIIESIEILNYQGDKLNKDYKYIFFNKQNDSVNLAEYYIDKKDSTNNHWIEKEYLENRINTDIEESYFLLNDKDKSVKFEVTDKSEKHENSKRFSLTTTINLLNAGSYPPIDPEIQDPPKKYRGIKYKE